MTKVFGQIPRFQDCALSTDSRALRQAQEFQARWLRANFLPTHDVQRMGEGMRYGTWSAFDTAREEIGAQRRGRRSLGQTWVPESMHNWMEGQVRRVMTESAAAEAKRIADAWHYIEARSVRWPRWNTIAFEPVALASFSLRNTTFHESTRDKDAAAHRETFAKLFRQLSLDAPNAAARALVEEAGERVNDCIDTIWLGWRYAIGHRDEVVLNLAQKLRKLTDEIGADDDASLQLTAITTIAALTSLSAWHSSSLKVPPDTIIPLVSSLIDASEMESYDVAHAAAATLGLIAPYVEDERVVVNAANVLAATLGRLVRHRREIGKAVHPMIKMLIERFRDVVPLLPRERYTYNAKAIEAILNGCAYTPNDASARSLQSVLVNHKLISDGTPMHSPIASRSPLTDEPFARLS